MSCSVSGTNITLTRGDTFRAKISIFDSSGTAYAPMNGDTIRFAMKMKYNDPSPILVIDIPIDTMLLVIQSEDTKHLSFGKYVYDIQLTKVNGDVDTFIDKAQIRLTEEVY